MSSSEVWVLFYVTRSKTGTPDQFWGNPENPVYLTDHWEICWGKNAAIKAYEKIFDQYDIHTAGIAPVDPEYRTDW
tara:strand:+ start:450 stop:677 length:228 start_codon:yes stop_codon:yes gene_type:complete